VLLFVGIGFVLTLVAFSLPNGVAHFLAYRFGGTLIAVALRRHRRRPPRDRLRHPLGRDLRPGPPEEWGPPASGPHIVLTDASQPLGDTFSAIPDPALLAITPAHVLEAARSLDGHRVIRPLTGEPRD
jgi:hypothetical protein